MKKKYLLAFLLLLGYVTFSQTPGGVSADMTAWFAAGDQVFNTSSGVATNGDDVGEWRDKSGNTAFSSNHPATISSGSEPSFTSSLINFHPAVTFDGNDRLRAPNQTSSSDYRDVTNGLVSAYVVGNANTTNDEVFFDHGGLTTNNTLMSTTKISLGHNSVDFNTDVGTNFSIVTGIRNGTSLEAFLNGTSNIPPSTTVTGTNDANQRFRLGQNTANNNGLNGNIAEVIIYDVAHDQTTKERIQSFLALKYGITLSHSLRDSGGSIIFNVATATSYNNGVVGLSRDDDSGLNQKVSTSNTSGTILTLALDADFTSANNAASRMATHANDLQFLVLGHNAGATTTQTTEIPSSEYAHRVTREWRVQKTANFTQNFNMKFDGFDNSYVLIKNTTGDFSSTFDIVGSLNASGEITTTLNDGDYITLAQQAIPGGVSADMTAWFTAGDQVFNTSSGVATNGDDVGEWRDKSGNIAFSGNHPATNNIGTEPSFTSSLINFHPAVTFDGTERLMSPNQTSSSDYRDVTNGLVSAYVVGNANTTNDEVFFDHGGLTTNNTLMSTTRISLGHNSVDFNTDVGTDFSIITGIRNGTSLEAFLNGTSNIPPSTTVTGTNDANQRFRLGQTTSNNSGLNGNIAEVIIYDVAHDQTTKERIQSFLALKYGITLSHSLRDSDGSIIFNVATATSYNNGIVGLSRDEGLNQKVSTSNTSGTILTLALDADFTSANNAASRTTTHANDLQFLVLGHNAGATTTQTTEIPSPAYTHRVTREWRVQKTANFTQNFNMKFDGFDDSYVLIKNTTGDFSSTFDIVGSLNASGEITTTLDDGDYITLAQQADTNDDDNDGIPNYADADTPTTQTDTDGDGITDAADPDPNNLDADGDGVPDRADVDSGLNTDDADSDGIVDAADADNPTSQTDTDNDGVADDNDPVDNTLDNDGDGILDGGDFDPTGTGSPTNGIDTDGDGINDLADTSNTAGTDTDGDQIIDIYDTSIIYIWNGTAWANNAPENNSRFTDNMLIQAGNAATISSAIDINDVTIETGATLSLSGDVNTAGDLSNNGTIDGSSTVAMDGTTAQDISGTGTINNLVVSNSNSVAFTGPQELIGFLGITNGSAVTTNGNLTFNSDVNGTAILAPLGPGNTITGNVNVERYIPAGNRAFRFLGSTVGGVSVFDSWQEAGNNAAGFGTHVTGTIGTVGTNNASNGHDESVSGNSSMFTWNEGSQGWNAVTNTKTETLTPGTFYRVLVRGDRTTDLSSNTSAHSATTLRGTGTITTGNFTVNPSAASGEYFALANPYQAKLDIGSVAPTNVNTDMYYWDPNLGVNGGYSTINIASGTGTAGAATNVLDPGQAVLFQAAAASASVVIDETDKVFGTANAVVFSTSNIQQLLRVKLYQTSRLQAGQSESDGMYIHFDSQFSDDLNSNDALKLDGLNANIAIMKDNGDRYAVERRTSPAVDEVVNLDITNYLVNDYTLVVTLDTLPEVDVFVKDNFTGTQTPVIQGGQTLVSYSIDPNNGLTAAADRFELVFQPVTLGLDDNDSLTATVSVYPNPVSANDALTISLGKSLTETARVNVYNTLGQQVITRLFESNSNGILNLAEVNDLSNGVYIITIETGEEKAVRRFIKQ